MDMTALARNWWALAIRGAAAIIFGLLTFVMPGVTLAVLVLLFGAYAIVDGIFNLIAAFRSPHDERPRWLLALEGLVSIGAGIVTFAMPGLTALVLVYIIAIWAIVTGVLEIVAAIRLRDVIRNEWWLVASGVLSVIFGLLLVVAPGRGSAGAGLLDQHLGSSSARCSWAWPSGCAASRPRSGRSFAGRPENDVSGGPWPGPPLTRTSHPLTPRGVDRTRA